MVGALAELVLRSIEETSLHDLITEAHLYTRYIDDVFVIWKQEDKLDELETLFTLPSYDLKLSLQQKDCRNMHFLDVQLIKNGATLEISVYSRSSSILVIIPQMVEQ